MYTRMICVHVCICMCMCICTCIFKFKYWQSATPEERQLASKVLAGVSVFVCVRACVYVWVCLHVCFCVRRKRNG